MNQPNLIHLATVTLLAWAGSLQAQTVNVVNNFGANDSSTIFRSDSSGLSANTRYLLGTFGSLSHGSIQGLFGADPVANLSAIYANFSILASFADADGGAFSGTASQFADPDNNVDAFSFTGNIATTFHNKAMQVVVLSPLADLGSGASEIGVFSAWDYTGAGSAVNFEANDESLTNVFSFLTAADVSGGGLPIGAYAIVGSSAGSTFTLSSATAIPEPASGSLFLLGATGVLALRRLRKSNV